MTLNLYYEKNIKIKVIKSPKLITD